MNIVLSIHGGSDKSEGIHYQRVLERLGHKVLVISTPSRASSSDRISTFRGFATRTRYEELEAAAGKVDLLIYVEPYGLIPLGMERAPFPTAAVICDTHNELEGRLKLARFFDHIFLYHRNYLKYFTEHPASHVHWMPFACDTAVLKPTGAARDLDVAFVGQLFGPNHERRAILKTVGERWKLNEQRYYSQHEIPELYSRARVVLNLPLKDDLNFRTFEAMSCGAMLLTRRVSNGQEVLFREGEHFAAFSDEKELFAQLERYLSDPHEAQRVASNGYTEVSTKHTLELRLAELVRTATTTGPTGAPVRRDSPSKIDAQYAWLYEYWKDASAGLELIRDARQQGRGWRRHIIPVVKTALRMALR